MSAQRAYELLVIGGGVTGCAAAYYAARDGVSVALVEAGDLNTLASGRNAGGLHAQIQHEPFVELGEDWARAFGPALVLLHESVSLWEQLQDELRVDLELDVMGGIIVASEEGELHDLERKSAIEAEFDVETRLLSRRELRTEAPYLSDRSVGGLLCPREGKASPLLATPALAAAAAQRGAAILTGHRVTAIDPSAGGFAVETSAGVIESERIIDCAGADAGEIARLVGSPLPVERHPIQLAVTEPADQLVGHLLYSATERLTLKQSSHGAFLIGGGWPAAVSPSGDLAVDLESLTANLRIAIEVVPGIATARVVRTWPGICPGTADHRPILGELQSCPGLIVALFPFLGFSGGPVMGRLAVEIALGRPVSHDLTPFAPERFVQELPA